jgi:hypothetical protein
MVITPLACPMITEPCPGDFDDSRSKAPPRTQYGTIGRPRVARSRINRRFDCPLVASLARATRSSGAGLRRVSRHE